MTPACHNRPPFAPGYWSGPRHGAGKPRWRWVENRMTRDCGSWKVPDGLVPYPVIVGWDCGGCKWKPE